MFLVVNQKRYFLKDLNHYIALSLPTLNVLHTEQEYNSIKFRGKNCATKIENA